MCVCVFKFYLLSICDVFGTVLSTGRRVAGVLEEKCFLGVIFVGRSMIREVR